MSSPASSQRALAKSAKSASSSAVKGAEDQKPKESYRDLLEQIVVALILALLIRGFEAEAFVIPTGSMATTLMGRHKEVPCPECGITSQVSASDEVDSPGKGRVKWGTCQNCRALLPLADAPSFKGDRILVMKCLYDLPFLPGAGEPERWNVVVFKYPEDPEQNYIKRLVGMPGEVFQIHYGDVRARPLDQPGAPFRHPRRPLNHQQAMQMLVWDDSHRPQALRDLPEWRRWQARESGAWTETPHQGWFGSTYTFTSKPDVPEWSELRYRNLVPDPAQWRAIRDGERPASPPRPTLVSDFYSYNTAIQEDAGLDRPFPSEPQWVPDLTLSCRVQASAPQGRLRLELVEAGAAYRCEIDLATGEGVMYQDDRQLAPPAPTGLNDTAAHDVTFANVDGRLTLWVDGATPFGEGVVYDDGSKSPAGPTAADLSPVAIATRNAAVAVSRLVLKRDVYYSLRAGRADYASSYPGTDGFALFADPERFHELARLQASEFVIRPGHYLMLGDNSPRSADSREWHTGDQDGTYVSRVRAHVEPWTNVRRDSWEVPRNLIVGKAFYIYWPHGVPLWPRVPLTPDLLIPFRPYFERMRWVR